MYLRHLRNSDPRKLSYLRTELQEKYSLRSYITYIENPLYRSTIAKLRTHSHCLLQESHTYLNCPAFCQNCNSNSIETPFHFLLECDNRHLEKLRRPIIDRLGITSHNKQAKFKDIMCGQVPINNSSFIYKTVHEMYEKRQLDDLREGVTMVGQA